MRYLAAKRIHGADDVAKLIDVMLWNGSVGVLDGPSPKYIFDSGYKRQYLAAIINADQDTKLVLHPTLIAAVANGS